MFDERLMMLFTRMTRRDTDRCPQANFVGERESSEFKQNLNGCPQADFVEERELSQINRELLGMTIADKLPEIAV